MKKEEIQFQTEVFETQRRWLQEEYKKAKDKRPKNPSQIRELELRVKHFEREVRQFKIKKQNQE